MRLQKKYDFQFEFSEDVTVTDCERVARSYAERGFDIIFYATWYPDAIKAIAKSYPKVVGLGAGGGTELHILYPPPEKVPANVGHYDSYLHESSYLCGYLAGKMTKTNIIGVSGGYPVINANRYFNGFIQGAKDANPNVKIKFSFLFTWYDPPKFKETALAQIEAGADIIMCDLQGAESAANERGVYYFELVLGELMEGLIPKVLVASGSWVLDQTFEDVITGVLNGKFEAKEYLYGLAQGGAEFKVYLPDKVPSDILNEVKEIERRILAGELIIAPNITDPVKYWGF